MPLARVWDARRGVACRALAGERSGALGARGADRACAASETGGDDRLDALR